MVTRSLIAYTISGLNLLSPVVVELEYFLASCLGAIRTKIIDAGYHTIVLILQNVADLLSFVWRPEALLSLLFQVEKASKNIGTKSISGIIHPSTSFTVLTTDGHFVSLRLNHTIR